MALAAKASPVEPPPEPVIEKPRPKPAQASSKPVDPQAAERRAQQLAENERLKAEWIAKLAAARSIRSERTEELARLKEAAAAAISAVTEAREQLAARRREFDQVKSTAAELKSAHFRRKEEAGLIEQQISLTKENLALLKRKQAQNANQLAIVPYDGASGSVRRPIYLECTGESIRILPEGVTLPIGTMEQFDTTYNPLSMGVLALAEYWNDRDRHKPGAPEPYVLLLVRPSGIETYYKAQLWLSGLRLPYGYELLNDDFPLAMPTPDDRAVYVVNSMVKDILRERSNSVAGSAPAATDGFGPGAAMLSDSGAAGPRSGGTSAGRGSGRLTEYETAGGPRSDQPRINGGRDHGDDGLFDGGLPPGASALGGDSAEPYTGGSFAAGFAESGNATSPGARSPRGRGLGRPIGPGMEDPDEVTLMDLPENPGRGVGPSDSISRTETSSGSSRGGRPSNRPLKPFDGYGDPDEHGHEHEHEHEHADDSQSPAFSEEEQGGGFSSRDNGARDNGSRDYGSRGDGTSKQSVRGIGPRGGPVARSRVAAQSGGIPRESAPPVLNGEIGGEGSDRRSSVNIPRNLDNNMAIQSLGRSRSKAGESDGSRRSINWGAGQTGTIGLEKRIPVAVRPGRVDVLINNEIQSVPAVDDRDQMVERVLRKLEEAASTWGQPPRTYYWVPSIRFIVYPGGNELYQKLHKPLKDWGFASTLEHSTADGRTTPVSTPGAGGRR
jgi:hypothetical protein